MRRQRAAGLLHCSACGGFYAGRRGLRDHQQIKHRTSYEEATEAVHAARGALVKYARTAQEARLCLLWEERAARSEAARHALSPGLVAARDGDVATLRALAAGGWEAATEVDRHGSTAMMWAAGGGHLGACELLARLGASAHTRQKKDGRTAMHWAARNGRLEVCKWLVEQGGAADLPTHDGTTPLHWAVWQGQLAVCQYLVDGGLADVHARNSYGCNAVQWGAQSDVSENSDVCRWLQSVGLDLTLLNHNGHSAVHKAALKGNQRVCEWLLSPEVGLGSAHLQADGDGNAPSRLARAEGFAALAAWLEAAEAAHALPDAPVPDV
jgi:ankyrin repeat protein